MDYQNKGASPSGDRATHEPSPTVLAVPVGIPSAAQRAVRSAVFRTAQSEEG